MTAQFWFSVLLSLQFEIYFFRYRPEVFRFSGAQVRQRFCFLTPKSKLILLVTVIGPPPYFSLKICLISLLALVTGATSLPLTAATVPFHCSLIRDQAVDHDFDNCLLVCPCIITRPGKQFQRCSLYESYVCNANQFRLSNLFREWKSPPLKTGTASYPSTTGCTVF